MKDIFTLKLHAKVRPNDILVKHYNGTNYPVKLSQRQLAENLTNILTIG